jgi:regulator of nucleoside diphosphate kinase
VIARHIVVTDRDFRRLSTLVRARSAEAARDQTHIDGLAEELARSMPVAASKVPADVVTMYSRVHLRDLGTQAPESYTLVFPHEADLATGRLSVLAPLGTALLGYRAGDEIEWMMPGGMRRIRIESVRQLCSATPLRRSAQEMARGAATSNGDQAIGSA